MNISPVSYANYLALKTNYQRNNISNTNKVNYNTIPMQPSQFSKISFKGVTEEHDILANLCTQYDGSNLAPILSKLARTHCDDQGMRSTLCCIAKNHSASDFVAALNLYCQAHKDDENKYEKIFQMLSGENPFMNYSRYSRASIFEFLADSKDGETLTAYMDKLKEIFKDDPGKYDKFLVLIPRGSNLSSLAKKHPEQLTKYLDKFQELFEGDPDKNEKIYQLINTSDQIAVALLNNNDLDPEFLKTYIDKLKEIFKDEPEKIVSLLRYVTLYIDESKDPNRAAEILISTFNELLDKHPDKNKELSKKIFDTQFTCTKKWSSYRYSTVRVLLNRECISPETVILFSNLLERLVEGFPNKKQLLDRAFAEVSTYDVDYYGNYKKLMPLLEMLDRVSKDQ